MASVGQYTLRSRHDDIMLVSWQARDPQGLGGRAQVLETSLTWCVCCRNFSKYEEHVLATSSIQRLHVASSHYKHHSDDVIKASPQPPSLKP